MTLKYTTTHRTAHRVTWTLCLCVSVFCFFALLLTACAESDDTAASENDDTVAINLAMNIHPLGTSRAATAPGTSSTRATSAPGGFAAGVTRLSDEAAQTTGTYRGIEDLCAIPYSVQGSVTATDLPLIGRFINLPLVSGSTYYYYQKALGVPVRTASFLCYCRATSDLAIASTQGTITTADMAYAFTNGSTITNVYSADRIATSSIRFSPNPIHPSTEAPAGATAIQAYMNAIAGARDGNNAPWMNTSDKNLQMLFNYFTNRDDLTGAYGIMPGSSASVMAMVNELLRSVSKVSTESGTPANTLKENIIAAIKTGVIMSSDGTTITSLGTTRDGYPANIGLPDGAAAMRWNNSTNSFEVLLQTTTIDGINSLNRFAFPPELYYYSNSQINTSSVDDRETAYSKTTWTDVLNEYEHKNGIVNADTKAAAVINQLNYGMGLLEATLQANSATLTDAVGQTVTLTQDAFPLTGIIISGQHPQMFNFTPEDLSTNEYLTYDRTFNDVYLTNSASANFHTLAYQTKDDAAITIVLELQNNSNSDFRGNQGIVYRGTKFYLVGQLEVPAYSPTDPDYKKRVFTQDCITTITMKVGTLAKAYNVVPDLVSARLEVGITMTPDWIYPTPTNAPF